MAYSDSTPPGRVVQGILADLPGLIAVAVVDAGTGLNLASHSNSEQFNPDLAAAYNTQVVKQNLEAMRTLRLSSGTLDDILITVSDQYHLIKLLNGGEMFVYLAVNSLDTNLAIAREVVRQHAASLN
ncbi:hypothetical protein ACFQ48_04625 [Hymenobacter caeli]|uniref:Roadblock/LC7 domain-containing protein n=1 Tax=Hymenobacter caeli TaxID=2735894 RepID=A0ABX2FQ48_9BACT|nr:hypothetical protein [Hymenobacter caeli]NRT19244.1 hypothetical protein [Hymenobacter caeli]